MSGLDADLNCRRGSFELSARLEVGAGEVLAVLGPNGSGKSTLLDCLAGLLRPPRASVLLGSTQLAGLPPHERRVGLLRQRPLLFPHLSVRDNVAFGPRARGATRTAARAAAERWLAEVDASEYGDRRPGQLSGGQQQRVALARALATEPELLLLDEPLAALDVDHAPSMRALLRRVLHGQPAAPARRVTVVVTHDPLDALALADTVLVMAGGEAVERGPTQRVLAAPRTPFTARLAGLNLVAGEATAGGVRTPDGRQLSGLLSPDAEVGSPSVAVFEPSAVSVYPAGAARSGSPRNTAAATVAALEPHGPVIRVRTAADGGWAAGLAADLTAAAVAELAIEPGSPITVAVKATAVRIHPAWSTEPSRAP